MTPAEIAVVAIAAITLGVLVVLSLTLLRHVKVLRASLRALQEDVRPVADEIQQAALTAAERAAHLADRTPSRGRDVRIRR